MATTESKALQRLRNRIEQEQQNLQVLDVALLSSHKIARESEGKMSVALGYDEEKYDHLHVPVTQSSRLMAQAKNANYRSAIITLYSLWTHYMKEILGLLYETSPHEVAAKAPGEMKFSEIIKLGNYEHIQAQIVNHVFRQLEDERSTKKLLDKILKHTKISLAQDVKINALAYLEMRHLFIHVNGEVDHAYWKTYHGIVPCAVGRKLPRRFKIVESAYEKVVLLCREVDRLLIAGGFINVR
ncbi:hypothetical protein HXX02_12110 [Microbulbifer elongatus]|uniref:RiboL-PSP-HEPN domain-containing protein n=1 Tax=Microbulbifer elongatus TaxID=86173 RepID=A0ABT1P242_9GAMM|nr:hypothetical protein [Microbulbifer elongatus]MCQ3830190.1 hypothetical protein [Microbulbifer elongatus]